VRVQRRVMSIVTDSDEVKYLGYIENKKMLFAISVII